MNIHFIGIGGIGVSALAKYYLNKGHKVSGSDLFSSEIIDDLKKLGAKISLGENKVPKNANLVIYSPAVKIKNLKLKIPALSYPQALGELTKDYFTIAISGTHGKSTTTAMLGLLLVRAGLDPTVIVGTKLKEFGNSNCRVGKSKYLIIEADEHFASFLNYRPKIIVLTCLEADHLDYYKNLDNVLLAFKKYLSYVPQDGFLVANKDDKNIKKILPSKKTLIKKYSLKQPEAKTLKRILKVPGEHNVYNALAALTAARALKIPDKISFKALAKYKGAWRRFEEKSSTRRKLKIINDYAHHPTEIKFTLRAAREKYPNKKICCLYQPHQYQRTYYLFNDFVNVFKEALDKSLLERLIITDIYDVKGREEKRIKEKISSKKIVEKIKSKKAIFLPQKKTAAYLKKNLSDFDILIIMGAGDIYNLSKNL